MANYGLLLLVTVFAAASHVMLKVGMGQVGRVGAEQIGEPISLVARALTTPLILAALPMYGVSFLGWAIVLSRVKLSVAQPTLAVTYVVIPLLSWFLLNESVSALQWIGIIVIFVGVLFVLRFGL